MAYAMYLRKSRADEELGYENTLERHEEMHTLEPKEQNDLLKMIVDRIEYEKTESGAAIEPTLLISLKI